MFNWPEGTILGVANETGSSSTSSNDTTSCNGTTNGECISSAVPIGVGVGIGVPLAIATATLAVLWLLERKKRKAAVTQMPAQVHAQGDKGGYGYEPQGQPYMPVEQDYRHSHQLAEVGGDHRVLELQ